MRWLPFIGSDDDDKRTSAEGDEMTIVSNLDESNIQVVGGDRTTTTSSSRGVTVHTISMDDTDSASATGPSDAGSRSASRTTPSPRQPSIPETEPEPTADSYTRGTFALPADRHFMQKLEARGLNGHGSIVETVYVLTGPTYTRPTDLIRLDNEEYYGTATRTSVSFDPWAMANKVADLYPDGETPKMIARFHTHPGGTLRPSSADKNSAPKVRKSFVDAFGTDDFEFFHGIHGIEEHSRNPGPDERQNAAVQRDHVHWLGEQFRHKLAVFGRNFETRKDTAIYRE